MNTLLVAESTTLGNTIDYIKALSIKGSQNDVLRNVVSSCKGNLKCLFDFAYDTAVYEPDPNERQILQSVEKTMMLKKANCVDYTILLSALLRIAKIPHSYRVVSYKRPTDYEHIYIVTHNGAVLDCVRGQRQDGTDTFYNRPSKGKFNQETNYLYKRDFTVPSLEILQGEQIAKGKRPMNRLQAIRYAKEIQKTGLNGNFLTDLQDAFYAPMVNTVQSGIKAGKIDFEKLTSQMGSQTAKAIVSGTVGAVDGALSTVGLNVIPDDVVPIKEFGAAGRVAGTVAAIGVGIATGLAAIPVVGSVVNVLGKVGKIVSPFISPDKSAVGSADYNKIASLNLPGGNQMIEAGVNPVFVYLVIAGGLGYLYTTADKAEKKNKDV